MNLAGQVLRQGLVPGIRSDLNQFKSFQPFKSFKRFETSALQNFIGAAPKSAGP